jgi:hypothetical protein
MLVFSSYPQNLPRNMLLYHIIIINITKLARALRFGVLKVGNSTNKNGE